jgi:site-specific recombinase XerD
MIHTLSRALRFYFEDYLARARGVSPATLATYRQGFALLCDFVKRKKGVSTARQIRLSELTPRVLLDFLDHLEDRKTGRGNSVATRNARLAAIRSFYAALPLLSPRYVNLSRQMEGLPFKRTRSTSPDYLEREELREVFAAVDRETARGMRDLTLLLFMYNMGARASEVACAKISWLSLENRMPQVRLIGKRNRERICPLWEVTRAFLKHYLASFRPAARPGAEDRLFLSTSGRSLSRWAIWAIVRRYVALASVKRPALARKHLTAHSVRHTLGMHLLQAGVDLSVIRSWLGHIKLETTQRYARVRVQDAQAAVERFFRLSKVFPDQAPPAVEAGHSSESLVQWLDSL